MLDYLQEAHDASQVALEDLDEFVKKGSDLKLKKIKSDKFVPLSAGNAQ